jgi:hypothetical protein
MHLQRNTLSPAEAASVATEAYIFLYPLVFMEAFRQAWAEKPNTFARLTPLLVRSLDGPQNGLALTYSVGAWIDLSSGPVMVTIPDTHDRHMIATVFDAWGEIVSSLGTRQGGGKGGRYVFAGPVWQDELHAPRDLSPIRASTNRIWISASIVGRSEADFDVLRSLGSKFRATVLSDGPLGFPASPRLGTGLSPLTRVTSMSDERFFSTAAALLEHNPIRRTDLGVVGLLQKLGIQTGKAFSLSLFCGDTAQSIQEGVAVGRATILAEHDRILRRSRESWGPVTAAAGPRHDYLLRAARIRLAPHTAQPEDHLVFTTSRDSTGEFLHGGRRYSLRFEPGSLPPTNALWSLTAIDLAGRLIARKPGRSIGTHRQLHYNLDGSLGIHVESTRSRRAAPHINWLQCPQGKFTLMLELFAPRSEVLQGLWLPPLVEHEPERRGRPVGAPPAQVIWLHTPPGQPSLDPNTGGAR